MKRITYGLIALLLIMTSCEGFDPTAIMEKIDSYEQRLSRLEARCDEMNSNISALQTIATAVERGDYITSITPILRGEIVVGYTISFAKSEAIEIYHGTEGGQGAQGERGEAGADGKDGHSPVIGVAQVAGDVQYYWTIDGEWLLDHTGAKIPVTGPAGSQGADGKDGVDGENGKDGITPKLKIEEGYWYVSYDNGSTWEKLARAVEESNSFFSDVIDAEDSVTFVLTDGSKIVIAKNNGYPIRFTSLGKQEIRGLDNVVVAEYSVDYDDIEMVYVNFEIPDALLTKSVEGWKSLIEVSEEDKDIRLTITPYLSIDNVIIHLTMVVKGGASYTITKNLEAMPVYYETVGLANCYIISKAGTYSIHTVKGNSYEPVGNIASVEVLWASFGTDVVPEEDELICDLSYYHGKITFTALEKKGNAVIAAKDAEGKILWSWHIWLTNAPAEEAYRNMAGIMMDRDLGATSATPGDPRSMGLMYQWGRKDPFIGGYSLTQPGKAATTNDAGWETVETKEFVGTISYAIEHPMTFITRNKGGFYTDWLYHDSGRNLNPPLWHSEKSIYDPCPAGYRVPDGNKKGVWATAMDVNTVFVEKMWDSTLYGMQFVNDGNREHYMVEKGNCWYPDSGYYGGENGHFSGQGLYGGSGCWWACTGSYDRDYRDYFSFDSGGTVRTCDQALTADGYAVRCFKEHSNEIIVN